MKQFNAGAKKLKKYQKVGQAGPRYYFEELFCNFTPERRPH